MLVRRIICCAILLTIPGEAVAAGVPHDATAVVLD
jgi:hypothetical protein